MKSPWCLLWVWPLAGCAHYLALDPTAIRSLAVSPPRAGSAAASGRLCARGSLVDVAATTTDGSTHFEGTTTHVRRDEFDPALVELTASIGTFHERSWNPPADPTPLVDHKIAVTAKLKSRPDVATTIELDPDWACDPPVALVGGSDGAAGSSYSFGAADPGKSPATGGGGGSGGNAGAVRVDLGYLAHAGGRLVEVRVHAAGGDTTYIFDRAVGLRVVASGGAGGYGGDGQAGPAAGSDVGLGGDGGSGGDGGDGGNGGDVTIFFDAASPELAKFVRAEVDAGVGGRAGLGGAGGLGGSKSGAPGQPGLPGRDGHAGKPGEVRVSSREGISDAFAHDLASHVAPPATTAPTAPRYSADDGARVYTGDLAIEATAAGAGAGAKSVAHSHVELISTRTQKRHFTIALGDHCALAFHRPEAATEYVYALDAPATCALADAQIAVTTAQLTLDPAHDTLAVSFSGAAAAPRAATIRADVTATRK